MKPWVATVPRMAQLKSVKKPHMAQQRASWPRVALLGGSRPRVAQLVQGPQVA